MILANNVEQHMTIVWNVNKIDTQLKMHAKHKKNVIIYKGFTQMRFLDYVCSVVKITVNNVIKRVNVKFVKKNITI